MDFFRIRPHGKLRSICVLRAVGIDRDGVENCLCVEEKASAECGGACF